jgi:hypothetical protein
MPANFSCMLPPETVAALDKYSADSGIPKTVIIARVLAAFFANATANLPKPGSKAVRRQLGGVRE